MGQGGLAPRPLRIVLIEDSTLFREGLGVLLAQVGLRVVAQLGDSLALPAVLAQQHVDVVITDACLPPTYTDEGIRAARVVRDGDPDTGVLVLSTYAEVAWARELLELGTGRIGYLLKDRVEDVAAFVEAIARVAAGGMVLDPDVVALLVQASHRRSVLDVLSEREREVLALMAQGLTNQGIGERLHLSARTVESHVAAIFTKLPLAGEDHTHNRRVLAVLRYLQETRVR